MKRALIITAACALISLMSSCGTQSGLSLEPTTDGCLMATKKLTDGTAYAVGPCLDAQGKISSYRTTWTNPEGVAIMSNYYPASRRTEVFYRSAGIWAKWDSKCGISLGGVPPIIEAGPGIMLTTDL